MAVTTAASKSGFSSAPNRSSNDVLERRFRDCLGSAAVRRDLRVLGAASDCGLFAVLRVFRTAPSFVGLAAVLRVFLTGFSGSTTLCFAGAPRRIPGLDFRDVLEGPLGRDVLGGPDVSERIGGLRLCTGGPRLEPPIGGPRLPGDGVLVCWGGEENERVGAGELVDTPPNGLQSSSSSSSSA